LGFSTPKILKGKKRPKFGGISPGRILLSTSWQRRY